MFSPMRLLLLFIGIPLLDLYLLLKLAGVMGGAETVLLVILTGVLGASMSRGQGLRVMEEWQRALQQGRMPEEGVLGGILWLLGSALLITPGVVTDLAGLLMLLPFTRKWLVRLVRPMVQRRIHQVAHASAQPATWSAGGAGWEGDPQAADVDAVREWLDVPEGFVSGGVVRFVHFGGSVGGSKGGPRSFANGPQRLDRSVDGKAVIDADFEVHAEDT